MPFGSLLNRELPITFSVWPNEFILILVVIPANFFLDDYRTSRIVHIS